MSRLYDLYNISYGFLVFPVAQRLKDLPPMWETQVDRIDTQDGGIL